MSKLCLHILEDRLAPATLPAGFGESVLAGGLSRPTSLTIAPDGRLFVTQQTGELRVVQNGELLPAPALTLAVDNDGERGLLGAVLDPNFAANSFLYLYYTRTSASEHRVSRFTVSGNTIDPASESVLLTIPHGSASNHNGGALRFGPDGKLFIAVGENAVPANAQSLNNLLGKILRINADGSIPNDNPFFTTASGVNRAIWALGLRNPYTFDIQSGSGRMFINDVGQGSFEEVNPGGAGRNYGWPATEGNFDQAQNPGFTQPTFAYPHVSGTDGGFAITGGTFYPASGGSFPAEFSGAYLFADFANNWIRRLDPATGQATLFVSALPRGTVDLDVLPDGSLLALSFNGGLITRIAAQGPVITQQPQAVIVFRTQGATFFVEAEGSPLAYQWTRNGVPIAGATGPRYTLPSAAATDDGALVRVIVSNAAGNVVSEGALLRVVDSAPPTPTPGLIGAAQFAAGSDEGGGGATLYNADRNVRFALNPYEASFRGGIRTAAADFTGDGVADLVVASGPGRAGNVRIFDGTTQALLFEINPFGDGFTRGVNVSAGDLTGDGKAEVVISAERGGGARIRIFSPTAAGFVQTDDFLGLIGADGVADGNFRGGARTAVGDVDGDGFGDLVFAAGAGGGPRIAIFNGKTLTPSGGVKLRGDFFAFEEALRDGTTIAVGDFDGDGRGDLVAGAGLGGSPRVIIFAGIGLITGHQVKLQDFFAGSAAGRGGVRLAVKNLDGDARADLLTSAGDGNRVTASLGAALLTTTPPASAFDLEPFPGFRGGLFVG